MVVNTIYNPIDLICLREFSNFTLQENIHRVMIMKKIFVILSFLILSGCQTTGGMEGIDKDWNVDFYDNCGLPKDSLKTIEEDGNKFLRFQLKGGQRGYCSTDRRSRNGASFWERSELKQFQNLSKSSKYELKFKIRFIEGFEGPRETFFQIHQWQNNCKTVPIIMFKSNIGIFDGDYSSQKEFKIKENKNRWINFKIILDFPEGLYSVKIDDRNFINGNSMGYVSCGIPHIKFGIYRPGWKNNETSIVDFDDFKLKEIK